ncbi:SDR family oxidoreductase [Lacisediminimonas sp.]|uniref:SDR family oxidoreductase n=1 Tax=Lacisediminimonas sp. TaxID=3060582 RepID=UPI0027241349|nr:SDR family oxidoreductase [Lacisediminimonas sp.]MDO8299969.1 SDR family oxidoreductase [Lacisediminimonas sp.]
MERFKDKVAVITGAASGFGREFARIAAQLEMKLVLADVQMEALDQVRAELEGQGAQVLAMRCDVRHGEQVQALADACMQRFGAVHLVFNNAGVGAGGLVWENTQADWEWVLGVNLWGVIHGVRIFTPLMLECASRDSSYQGHIVNTASMAGLLNPPTMGIYNVSKHAVVSLSESLYQDLKLVDAPIDASVLCPYFVPTGISQSDRNRPDELQNAQQLTASQRAAQAMLDKAVVSGKLTAEDVAQKTFAAIRNRQFYIYSHPEAMGHVQKRMEDILAQRNPGDPYETVPHVRDSLREKFRST